MKKTGTKFLLFFCMLVIHITAIANDTTYVLSKTAFLGILRTYHPVIGQADLMVKQARANILQARGAFDPGIDVSLDRKTFDGNLYYSYFNPQVIIPTWYGIDIKAGVEEITGSKVSNEASLGKSSYIGIKLPVNNLFFDSRRAVLKQAQTLFQLSEAERNIIINDLLFDALGAYWTWVREYQLYKIISDAVQVNEKRMRFLVTEFEQGSRPAIDTIEALAQLQNFYLQKNNAWLSFQNAGLELSNHMWLPDRTPFEWNPAIVPIIEEMNLQPGVPLLEDLLSSASKNHPKLSAIQFKSGFLQTDIKLKAQYLLPKVNINANLLSKGYGLPDVVSASFLENNYKLGFDLVIPLFFRQARGAYQAAKIKLQDNNLEYDMNYLQVQNKVKTYYNEVILLQQQLTLYEEMVSNHVKLFNGEKLRFDLGESTLFLLNSRENKLLETTQKLAELRAKWQKAYAGLLWSAGLMQ